MRSEIEGWTHEDGDEVEIAFMKHQQFPEINEMPVGYIGSGKHYCYKTVLHALGDGWKLLAPPIMYDDGLHSPRFEWWLVKD